MTAPGSPVPLGSVPALALLRVLHATEAPLVAALVGRAGPSRGGGGLVVEPAPGLDPLGSEVAGVDRLGDRAPGLAVVLAVGEPAQLGVPVDVTEGLRHRLRLDDQPDGADAGGVDQDATPRQEVQLAVRRRVTALGVAGAHVARGRDLAAEQRR